MKTILMLIIGLMLAGCGSMENHVRNRDAMDRHVIWWAILRWTRYALALDD